MIYALVLYKKDETSNTCAASGCEIKILIVEDEAIIAMDILNILKKLGFLESEVVTSGEESIRKAADMRPDLVLMDIKLKGKLDGIQAARQIINQFSIPVVYLTAFGDEVTIKKAEDTNPLGFIQKPFEERELSAILKKTFVKNFN